MNLEELSEEDQYNFLINEYPDLFNETILSLDNHKYDDSDNKLSEIGWTRKEYEDLVSIEDKSSFWICGFTRKKYIIMRLSHHHDNVIAHNEYVESGDAEKHLKEFFHMCLDSAMEKYDYKYISMFHKKHDMENILFTIFDEKEIKPDNELQEKIFALETNNKKLVEELKHKKEYDQQDIQEKVYEVFNAIEPQIKEMIVKVLSE